MSQEDRLHKWRLVLGGKSDPEGGVEMGGDLAAMSNTLDALYDSDRKGNLGPSTPNVNRWLGDIRKYFPSSVVQIMQRDALDKLGLNRMLLEPELLASVEPDVHLVATLLSLSKILPDKSKESARQLVRDLVKILEDRLRLPLTQAVRGSLHRANRTYRPRPSDIDWNQTIRRNLKHYQPQYKTIIPERLVGYSRQKNQLRQLILMIDQSGSMADSVVFAGVISCILASLNSIQTRVIAFDTQVADLSEHLDDPVDLLFAVQLGGGTNISKVLQYSTQLVTSPKETIMVLLSDLFEGGNAHEMFRLVAQIQTRGVQFICLLALNDEGVGAYDHENAAQLAEMGIPTFACTPDQFPSLMAAAIAEENIHNWMAAEGVVSK